MTIDFNEQDHIYMINGDVATFSVTKLLAKHKLANDYTGIDEKVLKNKARYGTKIHKDIENYINDNTYEPTTEEGKLFRDYAKNNLSGAIAEQLLGIDYNGLTIGGSCDLLGFNKLGMPIIADHKTYAQMTNETKYHIAWQLSIYDYMARNCDNINGVFKNWKGATDFIVLWYKKDRETKEISLEEIKVDKIDDDDIIALFDAEINGELYKPKELIIAKELEEKIIKAELEIARMELSVKALKEEQEARRNQIKDMMEKQGIIKWKSPNGIVKITYVPQSIRQSVDSKKLAKERPDIYSKYLKQSKVSSSLRVTTDYNKYLEIGEENGISTMEYNNKNVENE